MADEKEVLTRYSGSPTSIGTVAGNEAMYKKWKDTAYGGEIFRQTGLTHEQFKNSDAVRKAAAVVEMHEGPAVRLFGLLGSDYKYSSVDAAINMLRNEDSDWGTAYLAIRNRTVGDNDTKDLKEAKEFLRASYAQITDSTGDGFAHRVTNMAIETVATGAAFKWAGKALKIPEALSTIRTMGGGPTGGPMGGATAVYSRVSAVLNSKISGASAALGSTFASVATKLGASEVLAKAGQVGVTEAAKLMPGAMAQNAPRAFGVGAVREDLKSSQQDRDYNILNPLMEGTVGTIAGGVMAAAPGSAIKTFTSQEGRDAAHEAGSLAGNFFRRHDISFGFGSGDAPKGRITGIKLDINQSQANLSVFGVPMPFSFKRAPVVGTTGIELPEFNTNIHWFKHVVMRRNLNPLKLFTNWVPLSAMEVESRPVTRPVFSAVDRFMQKNGIITAVRKLQEDIIADQKANGGANVKTLISDFTTAKKADLQKFADGVAEVKAKVALDFKAIDEIPGGGVLKKVSYVLPFMSRQYGRYNITHDQKQALIKYLDDMIDLSKDLRNPAGNNAKEIADSVSRHWNAGTGTFASGLEASVNGLSRAYQAVHNAHFRLTKKGFAGQWGAVEWIQGLERSIQEGYYTGAHHKEIIGASAYGSQNLERTWQNKILPYADKNLQKTAGAEGQVAYRWGTEPDISNFFGWLEALEREGFGHESVYAWNELMRRVQPWGSIDTDNLPVASKTIEYFNKQAKYTKGNKDFSQSYKDWGDKIIERAKQNDTKETGGGTGLWEPLLANRQNRHYYITRSYPYRFAMRWPGSRTDPLTLGLAMPGRDWAWTKFVKAPVATFTNFWLGAKETKYTEDFSKALYTQKIETPRGVRDIWRTLVRGASGGAAADTWYVLPVPSKLIGVPMLAGAMAWGAGGAFEMPRVENAGHALVQLADTPRSMVYGGVKGWINGYENTSANATEVQTAGNILAGGAKGSFHGATSRLGDSYNTATGIIIPGTPGASTTALTTSVSSGSGPVRAFGNASSGVTTVTTTPAAPAASGSGPLRAFGNAASGITTTTTTTPPPTGGRPLSAFDQPAP